MTPTGWLAVTSLAGAAVIVGWPARRQLARRRLVTGVRLGRIRPHPRWMRWAALSPRRRVLMAIGLATGLGALAGGPVAAVAGGAYGGLAMHRVLRRRAAVAAASEHARHLDELGALAADLRAGLPASPDAGACAGGAPTAPANRIAMLTRAACRLAEQTGAPLAELIERIEADARAMDRAVAAATAQAAGARATAWLLAGLPLGGIALGYGIGADPLQVLLRTPVGAGCALGAIALQLSGLAWADRLGAGPSWRT